MAADIEDSRSARFALRCSSFAERWFPDSWVFAALAVIIVALATMAMGALKNRIEVEPLGNGCWQVILHYGFKNEPDVPRALKLLKEHGVFIEDMETSYFLSRDLIIPRMNNSMAHWREKLFAQMHKNASRVSDFLHLPSNSVVELGSKIEL